MDWDEGDITGLLAAIRDGDSASEQVLMNVLYPRLRQMAEMYLRKERAGHTLQPTALVSELYLRVIHHGSTWEDRNHFFACASRMMRQVLVDHARRRTAQKRGGQVVLIDLSESQRDPTILSLDDVLPLHQALDRLAQVHPRPARVVELRFFSGLSEEEIGDLLGKSPRTIKRDWFFARAWLFQELRGRTNKEF